MVPTFIYRGQNKRKLYQEMMRNIAVEHIEQVIGFLNENADYAVLRNFEGLPDNNRSRDIDIIITRKSYRNMIDRLVALICLLYTSPSPRDRG